MGSLKVNTILAARFTAVEEGQEIDEIKFFNTKSDTILKSTDRDRWFESKVREKFLVKEIINYKQKTKRHIILIFSQFPTGEHPVLLMGSDY